MASQSPQSGPEQAGIGQNVATGGFEVKDILSVLSASRSSEKPLDDVSKTALRDINEARKLRDQAIERGEAFSLAKASNEELITMIRAVALEGAAVALDNDIDPHKLTLAEYQLSDALGNKLDKTEQQAIDEASYVVASLALARLHQTTAAVEEQKASSFALGAMVDTNYLEQVEHGVSLGHPTGELAVQAIVEYAHTA